MSKWIVSLIAAAIITIALALAISERAQCYGCGGNVCYNSSSCLPGCSCIVTGEESEGVCVGIY